MVTRRLSIQEAFETLRMMSREANIKLRDVARGLVESSMRASHPEEMPESGRRTLLEP